MKAVAVIMHINNILTKSYTKCMAIFYYFKKFSHTIYILEKYNKLVFKKIYKKLQVKTCAIYVCMFQQNIFYKTKKNVSLSLY